MSETVRGSWKIRTRSDGFSEAMEIAIFKGDHIARVTFEPFEPHSYLTEPTIRELPEAIQDGDNSFLRAALNCAWELGMRPDGFNDTRESMAATKAHLEDMRAFAFHKIGAEKPTTTI